MKSTSQHDGGSGQAPEATAMNLGYDAVMAQFSRRFGYMAAPQESELRQSLEKLQRTLEETVVVLAAMIEKRDPYKAGHHQRVARLARAMAEEMGLNEERIEAIRVTAAVHDVGMIDVPAEILYKPRQLREGELGMVKAHPQVGYDLLRTVEFPWPVAPILLQHHERMDGSGYPRGLAGANILLEARILAVADVVEAMSSPRSYRPALGTNKALKEIVQYRGILYDPDVVDACFTLFADKDFTFSNSSYSAERG